MVHSVLAEPTLVESPSALVPLCVDLDGTLVRTDTLVEGLLALGVARPVAVAQLMLGFSGRAAFKRRVAEAVRLDPALLPYNAALLAWLGEQKAAGRRLVLVTAADETVARAIADHLGLFDEVIASDGSANLKGEAKARSLVARFGPQGFDYAGDSRADLAVWRVARRGVVVGAGRRVVAAARRAVAVEAEIAEPGGRAAALLRAMRPHQWVKNLLAFVPILTAQAWGEWAAWVGALCAFAAFSATASGIYLVNDLADLAADRQHPRKRLRPFARGAAPLHLGAGLAVALVAAGLILAHAGGLLWVVVLYALASLLYSARLKELPLVDVFTLAALYVARLVGGGEASGHRLSLWLLGFSSFLFLSLALVKRVEELLAVARRGGARAARRGYTPSDVPILQMFGCSSAVAASLVLALFVQSEAATGRYAAPGVLWGLVPLALFWQFRLWLATARGAMHDDPIVFAARDWVSWGVVSVAIALLAVAKVLTVAAS